MKKILILICLLIASNAWALSKTVCNTGNGCDYTSISAALTGVGSGNHTITVKSTYSAAENITISQSGTDNTHRLTITADVGYVPVVKYFNITGNNITVNGFKFSGLTGNGQEQVTINGNNVSFTNNEITGTAVGLYGIVVGYISSPLYVDNILIQGNNIHSVDGGQGIFGFMINSIIDNNKIHDFQHDPMQIFGHDITISNNEAYNMTDSTGDHVDFIQVYGDNGWYAYNITVEKNFVHDSYMTPFMLSYDGIVNIRNWTFRNNIFANLKYHPQAGIPYVEIYNNVFYNVDSNDEVGLTVPYGLPAYKGNNCTIKNNIFIMPGGKYYIVDSGALSTFVADYNFTSGMPTGYAAASANETHGVNGGNPYLVNIGGSTAANYALTSSSTRLIDKGVTISGFSNDYAGTTRPQGNAWDIGAFETIVGLRPNQPVNLLVY